MVQSSLNCNVYEADMRFNESMLPPEDRAVFNTLPAPLKQKLIQDYNKNPFDLAGPSASLQRMERAINIQRRVQQTGLGVHMAGTPEAAGTVSYSQQYAQAQQAREQQRQARIKQMQQGTTPTPAVTNASKPKPAAPPRPTTSTASKPKPRTAPSHKANLNKPKK